MSERIGGGEHSLLSPFLSSFRPNWQCLMTTALGWADGMASYLQRSKGLWETE